MNAISQIPQATELRRLAGAVRYHTRDRAGRRFRELVAAAGYEPGPGGWIYDSGTPGRRPVARGLAALAGLVADAYSGPLAAEALVERIRSAVYAAHTRRAVDDETLAYAADPELWGAGQADEADVAARHRAMHEGLLVSGRGAGSGQVVRHVETGAYGVFDRLNDDGAYVWFAGGDPVVADIVHPDDVAVSRVVELVLADRWDIVCPHCARLAVLDRDGLLVTHTRRDGWHAGICGGSGQAPSGHDRTGLVKARLLGPDLTPVSATAPEVVRSQILSVAVVEIGDGEGITVAHQDETTDGDRLTEALARAGYAPAYGHLPYDNLLEDASAIMLRRVAPEAAGPGTAGRGPRHADLTGARADGAGRPAGDAPTAGQRTPAGGAHVDVAWPSSVDSEVPRCRVCGCTEEQACPGGCTWAGDVAQLAAGLEPMDGELCSACLR